MMHFSNPQQVTVAIKILTNHILHVIDNSESSVHWLSVDFRSLLTSTGAKHTEARALILSLYQSVITQLPKSKTLIVSTFNFDFPNSQTFNTQTASGQTGAFGHYLIEEYFPNRIPHPFYSFIVYGEKTEELTNSYIPNSTGEHSIFSWLVEHNVQIIAVGHHYVKSLTSVHHAEHIIGVDYRYAKSFSGKLISPVGSKQIECSLYVRDINTCDFSSLTFAGDSCFQQENLLEINLVNELKKPLIIESLHHAPAHQLMVENLKTQNTDPFIDYIGPAHNNQNVITGKVADKLYLSRLKALISK